MIGAVGGKEVCLFRGAERDLLAGLTFPIKADGLHLDEVVRLFLQVPEDTGATRGIDLPNEALRVSVLPLEI